MNLTKPYLDIEGIALDIIIPWHTHADLTINCMRSIRANTANKYRIILVNNGLNSEDRQQVAAKYADDLLTMDNSINLGFIKAVNMGIARSTAPIICILNNDTEVPKDWDKTLLKDMRGYGIIGPVSSSGMGWQSIQRTVPDANQTDDFETINSYLRARGTVQEINGMVAFFCAFIRREVIENVGYLSEEFGIGFGDDDDYCYRARKAGFKVGFSRRVMVKHNHRTTFDSVFGVEKRNAMQKHNLELLFNKYPELRRRK